jgi:hypothetical protein
VMRHLLDVVRIVCGAALSFIPHHHHAEEA